jgi:putative zinc finger/helix-turn-helix YgiT family protein
MVKMNRVMKKRARENVAAQAYRRSFPFRCAECGKVEVRPAAIPYELEKNHDGTLHKLHFSQLHVNRCANCGEVYFSDDADREISAALRGKLNLLSPEQIRKNLAELHLTQKQAADRLGIAPETMSRWLSGAMIQSRAMDNLLRVFFECKDARQHLAGHHEVRVTIGKR